MEPQPPPWGAAQGLCQAAHFWGLTEAAERVPAAAPSYPKLGTAERRIWGSRGRDSRQLEGWRGKHGACGHNLPAPGVLGAAQGDRPPPTPHHGRHGDRQHGKGKAQQETVAPEVLFPPPPTCSTFPLPERLSRANTASTCLPRPGTIILDQMPRCKNVGHPLRPPALRQGTMQLK